MALVVMVDQVAKYAVRGTNFFPVVENSPLINIYLIVAALAAFIFFARKYFRGEAGAALIIGGAVSNLIDRTVKTTVTDFIDLHIGVINFADIAIYVGIALIVIARSRRRRSNLHGDGIASLHSQ